MEIKEILERIHGQKLYFCNDETLMKEQAACLEILYDFNQTRPGEGEKRTALLRQLLAEVGENVYIEPPLRANWGRHTHIGRDVYANFNLTLVDDTHIYIGEGTMIGPNVTLVATGHPVRPDLRYQGAQYSLPVHIGENVWIGANVTVLPGATIGDNAVIGANSLVTKDIPANTVAYGSPCKVIREINERDDVYYWRDRQFSERFKVKEQ